MFQVTCIVFKEQVILLLVRVTMAALMMVTMGALMVGIMMTMMMGIMVPLITVQMMGHQQVVPMRSST